MISFVLYILVLSVNFVVTKDIVLCENKVDTCACRFDHDNDEDFLLLNVDCSFTHHNVLQNNYTLPRTIHTLTASSNNINNLTKTNMLQSSTMKKLILNKNNITNIEVNALNLPNLAHLDLSDNVLEQIDPEIFKNVKKLVHLNLANNRFTMIADMAFHHLGVLEEIVLSGNDIGASLETTSLFQRHGLAIHEGIKRLSIANINLNVVHDNLLNAAYDLRYLKISKNNITTIPELPFTLEYLDFSDNPITSLYFEDFSNLLALKELQLNNLKIKEVPEFVFVPLKALKKLGLERNADMTKFSPLAFGREVLDDADEFVLEELSLYGSRLTTLSDQLEVPFGQLRRIDLQGNRWKCDCKILWIRNLQIEPQDYDKLRCYQPVKLYNTKIFNLKVENFQCGKESRFPLATVAAIAFFLIFGSIAVWFFVFIPRYQSRGHTLQNYIYPSTMYNLVPTERIN